MSTPSPISFGEVSPGIKEQAGGVQINFKRVLDRVIRMWYIVVLSLAIAIIVAFLINRYTSKMFPVRASIIIRESEENAGAKFLYDNALINPYRNFFNEIYIMKSFPLLQEVVEQLGFEVSFYREGEIMTTEFYDRNFPIRFKVLESQRLPYGRSMYLFINDEDHFSLQYVTEGDDRSGKEFSSLSFNDTIAVNGFRLFASKNQNIKSVVGQRYVIQFTNPLSLAQEYSGKLQATWAAPGASVVNLDVVGEIPQKEIDFLNKFIERYQAYDIEKKNLVANNAMKFLDAQLITTGDSLQRYEDEVESFKNKNVITGLGDETNRLFMKIQGFEDRKFQYRLNESYYKYITQLINTDQYEGIFTPGSVGIADPIVAGLITQVIDLQGQVNVYKSNQSIERSQENPLLKTTQQRISFLKADIIKAIENNRKTEQISIEFINDQIALVDRQLARLPSKERELVGIQRNYSLKEALYVFLLQKKTEAGLSKASTTSDIVIVNPPISSGSISPKTLQNYVAAGATGIILPLIVFILLEVVNNRIQSKEDIERITNVPFIGAVGHNVSDDALVVSNKPRSALAESFRALRSNLSYFTGNKENQVFMVTSTIPGEGKSFTSLNLATVLALAGKRTILLGADLRRPKLSDDLDLVNSVGLSQYLSGMATLEEIVQVSKIEYLSLIAGGPMPPNPSELLLRPEMSELIKRLKESYHYIVIDTPPVSFVADAFVLSKYADHTLYVIRQDFTPNMALQSLEEFYQSGKLVNISILFNDLRKTGLGYGYGGYGNGYGYGYAYGYTNNKNSNGYYQD
ncbi:MAG: polysaccharide biosynthesis tyrosine autokinase [Chryseolinea sp.]